MLRKLLGVLVLFASLAGSASSQIVVSGGTNVSGGTSATSQALLNNLITDGDSITFGVGVTTPWPSLINTTGYTVSNIAISGANCGSSGFTSRVSAVMVPGTPNIISIWCGTNNIAGGQTPSTAYGFLSAYISGARAYAAANSIPNLKIIVATMLSRDNPAGLDTNRAAWNNLIRANTAGADFVIDFDSLSIGGGQLGCNGCATTSGDFNTDHIHPNNAGELIEVAAFQAVIPQLVFVSQSGGSASCGADGTKTTVSVSTLNSTAAYWGPSNTIKLCGTITTAIVAAGSGSSGNPINLIWETGASVQVCSTTGAVRLPGVAFIVADLGGNSNAVECPNNGTGLSTTINALGIGDGTTAGTFGGSGFTNIEIRNGQIGPMFVHSGSASQGVSSTGIAFDSHGNNLIHDISFQDTAFGIMTGLVTTMSGDAVYKNFFNNVATGEWYASEGSSGTASGFQWHDNHFTSTTNWATTGNAIHQEALQIFANGAGTAVNGTLIYNNHLDGSWPASGGTAGIFIEQANNGDGSSQTGTIFNNILELANGSAIPGDGMIFIATQNNTFGVYNNTINCNSISNATGVELDGGTSQVLTFSNNIVENCTTYFYNPDTGGTFTGNNNIYNGTGGWVWQGVSKSTIAAWRTASSLDSSSSTSSAGLNSDYTITNSSSLAHTLPGQNLTSLSIPQLDIGAPQNFGASATCGTGCAARPSTGNWDVGAYPF